MDRYLLACTDHRLHAIDASHVMNLVPGDLRRGACGLRRCVPVLDTDTVPPEVTACPLCEVVDLGDRDTAGTWAYYQSRGSWVERRDRPEPWTGDEKGVTIPEADATEAHALSAGGLAYCERVLVDGVVHRLVRYTGTKPPVLAQYPAIYAAEVAALAATEVRE